MDWRKALAGVEVLEGEQLAPHTTFRIGGPARWFLRPETAEEAGEVIRLCRAQGIKPFFLGNGSNLLAADEGYDGVVLHTGRMDAIIPVVGESRVYAGCGVLLSQLAGFAAGRGLSGLEWAAGIPGTVGGAVRMNAGAYGGEMAQVVDRVDYLDGKGDFWTLEGPACGFAYRRSVFCREDWFITGASFRLTPGREEDIRQRMGELALRRREKQPLDRPSAGSAFKRPPPTAEGPVYAAALIDGCGLKGLTIGGAQVSEKHAGFIVNTGGATAADVRALMEEVRRIVERETGVRLEPEVEFLG